MNKKLYLIVIKEFDVQRPEKMVSIERVAISPKMAQDWLFCKILARFPNTEVKHSTIKNVANWIFESRYGHGYVFCKK